MIIIKLFIIIILYLNYIYCQNEIGSSSFETNIGIPEELNNIPFICYGNSNNKTLYLFNNTYIYKPYSIDESDSPSYLPNNCSMLHDISDKKKLSCCLKNNKESYDKVMNYIWSDKVMGNLISVVTNKTLSSGFKIVEPDGSTPDLYINPSDYNIFSDLAKTNYKSNSVNNNNNSNTNTDNSDEHPKVLVVYDTRKSVRTCLEHLVKIQCFRCSQDHKTILRSLDPDIERILSKEDSVPLFYQTASITLETDIINGTIVKNNITNGKPIAICNNEPNYYFDTLMKHCQYVTIGGIPINKLYKPVSNSQFKPPSIVKYIKIPHLQEFSYVSIDNTDSFYVSNYNCFQLPIDSFEEPQPTLLINKVWAQDLNNTNSESNKSLSSKQILSTISIFNLNIIIIIIVIILL